MTGEGIKALEIIVALLGKIGAGPFLIIVLAVILTPWILMYFFYVFSSRQEAMFREMSQMYQNNVVLVENYESITGRYQETLVMCVEKLTEVLEAVKTNTVCPIIRDQYRDGGNRK